MRRSRRVGLAIAGLVASGVVSAVVSGSASAQRASAEGEDLRSRVVSALQARAPRAAGGQAVVVTPARQDGRWAFGTAVLTTPAGGDVLPEGWLFAARQDGGSWTVALEGEPAFAELTARSPLTTADERPLLAAQDGGQVAPLGAGDLRTGMALPFAVGQTWSMSGGPHGWSGAPAPWSSLDLAGGDQRVRAARAGTAYTMCTGWVRVIHDRGYSTDYYHLWNNISANGTAVAAGAYLGDTGTDVTCGGSALGRHVHFALRQNSAYIGIADHNVGKWVPQNGGSAYNGSALHGSARTYPGGSLHNHGALGFTQGVIDANGTSTVNRRTGPGTGYALAGTVADGATVSVACSRTGTSHTGRWGTTSLWNRLTDGTWVTDAYMWTGMAGAINGTC